MSDETPNDHHPQEPEDRYVAAEQAEMANRGWRMVLLGVLVAVFLGSLLFVALDIRKKVLWADEQARKALREMIEEVVPPDSGIWQNADQPRKQAQSRWPTLDAKQTLTRIAFGSCLSQRHPQPIWQDVLALSPRPQAFLMMGDNVYGDDDTPEMTLLAKAYKDLAAHPEFSTARKALPFFATWDDHDFGVNDGGAAFPWRHKSEALFRNFWKIRIPRRVDGGIYYAKTYGPEGRRVQMIFLDTRSHRSIFQPRLRDQTYKSWGHYEPDYDTNKTMLGNAQWQWLLKVLQQPADLRIVVSSIQVWSDGHGFERWGNLPNQREVLKQMIMATGAKGLIFLSGDRHMGALYAQTLANKQIVPEVTSSSLNRSYGPSKDLQTPELISGVSHVENFGVLDIDWAGRRVMLSLRGLGGRTLAEKAFAFDDLQVLR